MTDEAERKTRQWALKKNGDPLSPRDVVELVFALSDDHDKDHAETMEEVKKINGCLAQLNADHESLALRMDGFDEWRRKSAEGCQERIEAIVRPIAAEMHEATHKRHLDESHAGKEAANGRDYADPSDSQFLEHRESAHPSDDEEMGDIRRVWRFARWFVAAALLIALDILAHRIAGM